MLASPAPPWQDDLMPLITRFAPSPTGHLHLGHAFAAWAVAAWAQHLRASMLLRLEDIDQTRCRPEFEESILADLKWLGLNYEGPILRQSQRMPLYAHAIDRLKDLNLIYPCSCTRAQVLATSQHTGPDGPLYSKTCWKHGPTPGQPVAWRLNMNAALSRAGNLRLDPRPWGDLILVRRQMPTSYHISVVVDDADQGVSHVMRGTDLQGITAVHQLLQTLLGLPIPAYAYHSLLTHSDGRKFSKSERAPTLRDLRTQGFSPHDLKFRLNSIPNLRGQIDAIKAGNLL